MRCAVVEHLCFHGSSISNFNAGFLFQVFLLFSAGLFTALKLVGMSVDSWGCMPDFSVGLSSSFPLVDEETVKPHLPLKFFFRGGLPVVAVLHWNYLRYSRGRGYFRRLGSPGKLRRQALVALYRSNSTACTLRHALWESPPVGPRGQQHTPLTPISGDRSPIRHLGMRWIRDEAPRSNPRKNVVYERIRS